MKTILLMVLIFCSPLFAEEVFLTCSVTQMAASKTSTKVEKRLRKIGAALAKEAAFKDYTGLRSLGKKNLSTTKDKSASLKLKNGSTFSMRVISVVRQHRKNTIKLDVTLGNEETTKSFIDRHFLFLKAGEISSKDDLVLAVSCPLFP